MVQSVKASTRLRKQEPMFSKRKEKKLDEAWLKGWNAAIDEVDQLLEEIRTDGESSPKQLKLIHELQSYVNAMENLWRGKNVN